MSVTAARRSASVADLKCSVTRMVVLLRVLLMLVLPNIPRHNHFILRQVLCFVSFVETDVSPVPDGACQVLFVLEFCA